MQDWQAAVSAATRLDDAGQIEQAATAFRELLAIAPDDLIVLCRLGSIELRRHDAVASVQLLERAVELRPEVPEIHLRLGLAYQALSKWGSAAQAFEQTIALSPGNVAAHFHLAEVALTLGQFDAAVALFRQTISLDPAAYEPFVLLGHLLLAHQNWGGAEQCYREALQLLPTADDQERLDLQSRRGIALLKLERLDEAAGVFHDILAVAPNLAEIHGNLAYVLERQGKIDAAVTAGQRAVEINPRLNQAWNNLGVALRSLHDLDGALEAFREASALEPDDPLAEFNTATVLLHQEDYRAGWPGYEARRRLMVPTPKAYPAPRWTGEPVSGTLLLHAEQGYGDTIQFSRFIPLARERSGARIAIEAPAALADLMRTLPGVDEVILSGQPLPPIAAEAPLPSLMGILNIDSAQLPFDGPYLQVDQARIDRWHDRLRQLGGAPRSKNVGLVWRGNREQSQDVVRSCPLAELARLRGLPNIKWFSLQQDHYVINSDATGLGLIPLGHLLTDFSETAAAMSALDLVISVDTAPAHLAGALGLPVWTLLCHTPDWRWGLTGSESPWYPSMRLFRQSGWGDWAGVLDEVRDVLAEFAGASPRLSIAG